LRGAKNWTAHWYENKHERQAYVAAFSQCEEIVRQYCDPEQMLLALDVYHDEVMTRGPRTPFFFSLGRLLSNEFAAEEQAIRVAFQIVDSITKRFL
jgi:hypothetical protein